MARVAILIGRQQGVETGVFGRSGVPVFGKKENGQLYKLSNTHIFITQLSIF